MNVLASSTLYEIDSAQLLRISIAADDADEVIWGIVHSHVASPAKPSATDTGVAGYPDFSNCLSRLVLFFLNSPSSHYTLPSVTMTTLDHIWIERSLSKKFDIAFKILLKTSIVRHCVAVALSVSVPI